jgi:hypothetical protein
MKVITFSRRKAGPGTGPVPSAPRQLAGLRESGRDGTAPLGAVRMPGGRPGDNGGPPPGDGLQRLAEACHAAALEALSDPDLCSGYRAIALLSRHLAVTRVVLCPAAHRRLGPDHWLAAAYPAGAREAERALRLFERRLAGDAHAARMPAGDVRALLDEHLGRYRAVERAALAGLARVMPLPERERLAGDYRALLASAPTRPHPRAVRAGLPGLLVFRLHSFSDRVLNALDSRPGTSRLPP